MKTIYLHVGMYKTGTSFIQKFCCENQALLESKNLYYPVTSRVAYCHYDFCRTQNPEKWLQMIEGLKKEIETCGCDHILISIEHLINNCNSDQFAQQLKTLFNDWVIKIIIYFRRQDLYLESLYNQESKLWFSGSIEEFLQKEIPNNQRVCAQQLDYYAILEKLAKNFGHDNIIAKAYEPDGSKEWLLHSFFSIFEINQFDEFKIPEQVNQSLKCETINFLKHLGDYGHRQGNAFYATYGGWQDPLIQKHFIQNFIDDINPRLTGTCGYFLSPTQRKELCLKYEEGNAKIAKEFLNPPQSQFFNHPLPDEKESWQPQELSQQTMVEIITALHLRTLKLIHEIQYANLSLAQRLHHHLTDSPIIPTNKTASCHNIVCKIITQIKQYRLKLFRSWKS